MRVAATEVFLLTYEREQTKLGRRHRDIARHGIGSESMQAREGERTERSKEGHNKDTTTVHIKGRRKRCTSPVGIFGVFGSGSSGSSGFTNKSK